MKIEAGQPIILADGTVGSKVKVYDCVGQMIPYVLSYDTETFEIEVVMQIKKKEDARLGIGGFALTESAEEGPLGKREVARLRGVLKGSYCEVDGVRI